MPEMEDTPGVAPLPVTQLAQVCWLRAQGELLYMLFRV